MASIKMNKTISAVLILLLAGLLTACATPRIQSAGAELLSTPLLSFIRDGVTTREEVLLKLGAPSADFEEHRILTYRLVPDREGTLHVLWPRASTTRSGFTEWAPGVYSLVLVFKGDGVLEKHSLVVAK